MGFSFGKLLNTFGNKGIKEQELDNNNVEAIMSSIEDQHFAVSDQNVMYAAINELGGYYYLKTIIVGAFKIKTMKGATLSIKSDDLELDLVTDMDEFESEHTNISKRYVTRIDFQVNEEDVPKIDPSKLNSLELKAKKHSITFQFENS